MVKRFKKFNDDVAQKCEKDNVENENDFSNDQKRHMLKLSQEVANYDNDAKALEDAMHNSLTDQQNLVFSFDSEEVKATQQLGISFEKQPSLWELTLLLLKNRKPIFSLSKHLVFMFPPEITSEYSVYRYLMHNTLYTRLKCI